MLAQSKLIDNSCKIYSRGIVPWIFAFDFFNLFSITSEGVGVKTAWASLLQCTFCMDTSYKKACIFSEAPQLFMLLIKEIFQAPGIKGAGNCRGPLIFDFFLTSLEVRKVVLQEHEYGHFWCKTALILFFITNNKQPPIDP